MASKQEWEEYFELIHGRKPNEDEAQAAQSRGDYDAPQAVTSSTASQQAPQQSESKTQQNRQQRYDQADSQQSAHQSGDSEGQTDQHQRASEARAQVDETYNRIKQHTGNYFSWYLKRALHPTKYINDANPKKGYLWLSFGLTTVFAAGIFWNIVRRVIDTYVGGVARSLGSVSSSATNAVGQVSTNIFIAALVAFAVYYFAALPGLAWITRGQYSIKEILVKYLGFFPAAGLFSAAGFLYSFVAPVSGLSSFSNVNSLINFFTAAYGPLMLLPLLSIATTAFASYYFIQKTRIDEARVDVIWWQFAELLITLVVVWIATNVIITPVINSMISGISNLSSNW